MNGWSSRDFTVAEAAALCGIPRGSVDVLTHRARDVDTLFSEKRGRNRWFSPRDIAVLRVAFELMRSGRGWLTAIGAAFDNLQTPPTPDTYLVAPAVIKRGCGLPRLVAERDLDRLPFDVSTLVVPIGKITAEIIARCAELEGADVAV